MRRLLFANKAKVFVALVMLWTLTISVAFGGQKLLAQTATQQIMDTKTLIPVGVVLAGVTVSIRLVWWVAGIKNKIDNLEEEVHELQHKKKFTWEDNHHGHQD